jgi:hypothetical protein
MNLILQNKNNAYFSPRKVRDADGVAQKTTTAGRSHYIELSLQDGYTLPNPPVQAGVLEWWYRFQDDFLVEEQRRYYSTTKPKDLTGAEAQRQIDLFVKRKNSCVKSV